MCDDKYNQGETDEGCKRGKKKTLPNSKVTLVHHSIMYKLLHLLYSSQAMTCILQYSHASQFILQIHFKQLVEILVQVIEMDTRTAE